MTHEEDLLPIHDVALIQAQVASSNDPSVSTKATVRLTLIGCILGIPMFCSCVVFLCALIGFISIDLAYTINGTFVAIAVCQNPYVVSVMSSDVQQKIKLLVDHIKNNGWSFTVVRAV